MILTLIREQVRSQARYTGAAFALIAVATSLAAFVLISLATAQREAERIYDFLDGGAEHHAWLGVWTDGAATDSPIAANVHTYDMAEVDSIVAGITANGSAPEVRLDAAVWIEGDPIAHRAAAMESVPQSALKAGTSPQVGQVVVDSALAESLGLTVGDSLGFSPGNGLAPTTTLEVSGILRGSSFGQGPTPARIVFSAPDGLRLIGNAGFESGFSDAGERTVFMGVELSWNGAFPAALGSSEYTVSSPHTYTNQKEYYAITALWLVLVTALVAAAAAGRSQGAARSQWVGTVRALGATRRDVVTAAMVETATVGVVAGIVGVAIGAGVNFAVIHRQGGTFAGDWPSLTAASLALSIGLALAVSIILGAAPAYWAARTTPAAALGPVGPADAMPPRQRVGTNVLAVVGVGAAAVLLAWTRANGNGEYWPKAVLFAVTAALALSVYLLTSRAMVRVVAMLGNALTRRRERILVAAGGGLTQNPRNAASIATAIAAGGIGAGAIVWHSVVRPQQSATTLDVQPWAEIIQSAGLATLLTAAFLGAAALVLGLAIWIGRGRVAGDAAIYGALGLSRRDRQVAAMIQVALAAFTGGLVGMVAGTAAAAAATGVLSATGTWALPSIASPVGVIAQGVVVWLGALLGVALVSVATSLAAGRASDGKDPAALRRSASRAGATF